MKKNILVVAAHPDDEILGCGGALINHRNDDDDIYIIYLSDGESSREGASHDMKIENRKQQAISVCEKLNVKAVLCSHWANGSGGTKELAEEVVKIAESSDTSKFSFTYEDDVSLEDKIRAVAQKIYRADDIVIDKAISDQLKGFEDSGYGKLPICIAKTQYSFSTNPALRGAPTGFTVPVREVRLSAGAGFIVVVTGAIMTMPGLPKVPSANSIVLDENGLIQGLF